MSAEFKLVDNKNNVLYKGYMAGERLERADIQVDNNTYLDIISNTKYILWGDYIYNFERYLEESMTKEERDMPVGKNISFDNQGDKPIHRTMKMDCSQEDFTDYCEYIRDHQDC